MVIAALVTTVFPPGLAIQSRTLLQFNQLALTAGTSLNALVQNRSNVSALFKWELVLVPVLVVVVATNTWRINRLLDLWTVGAVVSALVGLLDRAGLHALAPVAMVGDRSARAVTPASSAWLLSGQVVFTRPPSIT
jgi:hypothetical protein